MRTEQRTAYATRPVQDDRSQIGQRLAASGRIVQPETWAIAVPPLSLVQSLSQSREMRFVMYGWPRNGRVWAWRGGGVCVSGSRAASRPLSSAKTSGRDVSLMSLPCRCEPGAPHGIAIYTIRCYETITLQRICRRQLAPLALARRLTCK